MAGTLKRGGYGMSGLNIDRAFALEQVENDEDLLQQLFTILQQSCATDLALMKKGVADGCPAQVQAAAHSIKGASASLGIRGLRDAALSIELDAKRCHLEWVERRIPQLEKMLEELKKF